MLSSRCDHAWRALLAGCVFLCLCPAVGGADAADDDLTRRWQETVLPFLTQYCLPCHGETRPAAQLRLDEFRAVQDVGRRSQVWRELLHRLDSEEMPPADAEQQPPDTERAAVMTWIRDWRRHEAQRTAGDPGLVPARRLSNAELDHTIRDLAGVDLRPSREFPVDPANEAGFDNSGESLTMSPALFRKYLAAMRQVADHLVLTPGGLEFAPHPVATDTDRDKYCVHRIIEFYRRHTVDQVESFVVVWRYLHRNALGRPLIELDELAREAGASAPYVEHVWKSLSHPEPARGPLAVVRSLWAELPAPKGGNPLPPRAEIQELCDLLARWRQELKPAVPRLHVNGLSDGTQPFVLWRNRELAARHRSYQGKPLDDLPRLIAALPEHRRHLARLLAVDPVDEADIAAHQEALQAFCQVFPLAFFVDDRGPYFDPSGAGKGRLLTAGFHLMQGYFRDDAPLAELVLEDPERQELDRLWDELHFVTGVLQRQYQDYIFFERAEPPRFMQEAEFDFARSEDKDCSSEAKLQRLQSLYLAKARRLTDDETALGAIQSYFESMSREIRAVERARLAAEPVQLEALLELAGRAWRHPLTEAGREELLADYRLARSTEGLSHEDAVRDTLVSVLLAPQFCYRFDLAASGSAPQPLSDFELASRLSYFLWASLPDDKLLTLAAAGQLHEPECLLEQTRRMLRDPKVRGLATEFGGNWLDFRRFDEHNSVDRDRFPVFTNDLRQAMFEEPVRFLVDLVQNDRSVLDCLAGTRTLVNPVLAAHYGIPHTGTRESDWLAIDDARPYGRGGLLPMAVFLTRNSPGLRTSPVKRGYWVVRRLLGEHIPPPPPTVPELPQDEQATGDLTIPQLLARHRDNQACAGCHQRFDAIGVAFEGFGPVGDRREFDLAGRLVETRAAFPDGVERTGLSGLQSYLGEERQSDFQENLCRKLLAYALGRSLQLSDEPLLESMQTRLAASSYTLRSLIETIVLSPQFLTKRGDVPEAGAVTP